jgi:hypothetical protein
MKYFLLYTATFISLLTAAAFFRSNEVAFGIAFSIIFVIGIIVSFVDYLTKDL